MAKLLDVGLRIGGFLYLVFQFVVLGPTLLPAVLFVRGFWVRGSIPRLARRSREDRDPHAPQGHAAAQRLLPCHEGEDRPQLPGQHLQPVRLRRARDRRRRIHRSDAVVSGHAGEGGMLRIRPVRIGAGCTVGQSSILLPGSTMEDGSVLGARPLLPKGRTPPVRTT
jgi:hypothetical protein